MNFVNFTGLLGKDPVVRESSNGKFLSLRVAVEKSGKGNGQFQERTVWVSVISDQSENIENFQYFKKGKRVSVSGRLKADKNGNLYVKANVVSLAFKRIKQEKKPVQVEETVADPVEEEVPF